MQPVAGNTPVKKWFWKHRFNICKHKQKIFPWKSPGIGGQSPAGTRALQCCHITENKQKITYFPVPETKYNLAESCVNMWWNFAVIFWIIYKSSWPANPAIGFREYLDKHRKKGFTRKSRSTVEFSLFKWAALQSQISIPWWHLSLSTLDLQKQCDGFFLRNIKKFESNRVSFLKHGLFGCCGLSANPRVQPKVLRTPWVCPVWDFLLWILMSLNSWRRATKGCSPYSAPGIPAVSPWKTFNTQHHQTAKDLMKGKACMLRGRIFFSSGYFWSWIYLLLNMPFATTHRNSPLILP